MHCFIILVNLCALSDTCYCFSVKQKKKQLFKLYLLWIMLLPWRLQTRLVKKRMWNHPGKQITCSRNESNILCCVHVAAAATGETRPPQNRANGIWLGQRKDGRHHVVALISKPWLRKRKLFTEVAASRGLVFPKWQRPQWDLGDEDG